MAHGTHGKRPWILALVVGVFVGTWAVMAQQARRVDDNLLKTAPASGEEWLTYGLDLGEKRFSPLKQIDTTNVARLAPVWSFDIPGGVGGPPGGGNQEATPLVWNRTLYSITTWSIVYAVDARTGKELWHWDPEVNRAAVQPKICCGVVNRGVAIYQGKIIAPVIDGRLVALDALTGKPVWESRVSYSQDQYTLTMAPRMAKGKVILGAAGSEYPVRGFVDAYDANTGQRAWRFYTIPGDPSKPFENEAMRKAAETWSGDWFKMGGGGTAWDALSYDPDADLVYFGTGNGGPWPEALRGSRGKDNLYVCSIIALRPDTGELKWYYQAVPGDSWDYDSVQQLTLADVTIGGRPRKVIMQANKNGFFYVIDRVTGEFISADPFAPLNWAKGVDANGRPIVHPESNYGPLQPVTIFPGPGGAHNWSPMSFNPATGFVYIPSLLGSSSTYTINPNFIYTEGGRNTGIAGRGGAARGAAPAAAPGTLPATPPAQPITRAPIVPPMIGPTGENQRGGVLIAWDPAAKRERWRGEGGGSTGGGTMTTAGNLVFQVLGDGRLLAYSADKGERLLDLQTGQRSGMGPPITYMIDGRQYISVTGGRGAGPGQPAVGTGAAAPGGVAQAAPAVAAPPTAATGAPPRVVTYAVGGSTAR